MQVLNQIDFLTITNLKLLCDENNLKSVIIPVFRAPQIRDILFYFLNNGAASARILHKDTKISEASTYRAIDRLRTLKLIIPIKKLMKPRGSKGGPRPTLWGIPGVHTEEIRDATKRHYNSMEDLL